MKTKDKPNNNKDKDKKWKGKGSVSKNIRDWWMPLGVNLLKTGRGYAMGIQPPVKELPTFPFLGFYSWDVTDRHKMDETIWRKQGVNRKMLETHSFSYGITL